MIALFASLATDVEASFVWLWGAAHAVVTAVAAAPAAIVSLF